MIRVTLDSNEYISAFAFRGKAIDVFHQAISGEIVIAISEPILNETLRVLREKFEWQPYEIHTLRERLLKTCLLVTPKVHVSVLSDEPDNRILECAREAGSHFIISEDRAMLRVKEHAGAKIVTAAEFVAAGRGR